ncbi:MAG TPA: VCBS repeat-containing protein, partial [Planctomycetota bacterium]|nr:VCBS repeat-containing protein [Planctomycetota bacterium]
MNARSSLFVAGLCLLFSCGSEEPLPAATGTAGGDPVAAPAPAAAAPAPAPVGEEPWFTEEAAARGITLPNGSGKLRQKELIMEAVGPGAAVIDANKDGLLDVYIPNGNWLEGPYRDQFYKGEDRPRSALYIQQPGGTFRDEAKERGVEDDAWAFGACAADLDNDGDEDLVVCALGPNRLFVNDGTGHFRNVALDAGVAGPAERGKWEWSNGVSAGDYDRDGILDLYVTNYADLFKWMREAPEVKRRPDGSIENARVCTWQHLLVYCGPKGLPGQQDHLYRGLGGRDGAIRFEDVTGKSGIFRPEDKGGPLYGFQALFTDLDNDGWPDLYVANDSVPSFCFLNQRDGTFRECAQELGVALSDSGEDLAGMGASSVDMDGDGWLDINKTNFAFQTNNVY